MLRVQASETERDEPKYVVRTTITDDLKAFLEQPETNAMGKKQRAWSGAAETAWLSPERQYEEAWFLGLRLNAGVDVTALEREFGAERVESARAVVDRQVEAGLVEVEGQTVRLTSRGRLLSNDVFQEFLDLGAGACATPLM